MTLEDVWKAIDHPEPLMSNHADLSPGDTRIIVLLRTLRSAGVAREELYSLCALLRQSQNSPEKIKSLRNVRFSLLARIHEQQRALDALDGYVEEIKQMREQTGG